jgi:hypothetical protein
MKTWIAFLTFVMCFPAFANIDSFGRARDEEITYRIDPSVCIANLVWNEDYTHAECVVDAGKPVHPMVSAIEETAGFDFPRADTYGKIRFRPNGYIVELDADQPMDPDRTLNLLGQTLAKLGPFEVSLFSPISSCEGLFD